MSERVIDETTLYERLVSIGNDEPWASFSCNILSNDDYYDVNKLVNNLDNFELYEIVFNSTVAAVPYNVVRSSNTGRIKASLRGLRTKTAEFLRSSVSCDHDVIVLTETSLHPFIFDGELFDTSKFLVHRCDRSKLNSESSVLGGALVAVRSHVKSELVTVPGIDDVEMVVVKLYFDQMNIYICCVYIPSGSLVPYYQQVNDAFVKVLEYLDLDDNDELFVFGDFNLSNVDWIAQSQCTNPNVDTNSFIDNNNVLIPYNMGDSVKTNLLHLLLSADLHQMNGVRNCDERILDLAFTSNPFNVEVIKSPNPMVKVDPYHVPI